MGTSRTPHMNITIPDDTQPGPAYADNISQGCLYPLGEHTHDGVNTGALINIAGQTISNDLNLDGYNLAGVRAARFNSQGATLTGINDVNEFYVVNGNAYFNNADGYAIALTNGNQAVTLPFNNFTPTSVSSTNLVIPSNAGYNLINASTSTSAVVITLPLAAAVPAGRFFIIQDVGNAIASHALSVQVPGGSGNLIYYDGVGFSPFFWSANGQSVIFVSDGVSNWHTFNFWKNAFLFEEIELFSSTLVLDGYSALDGYGTFTWNNPATAFSVTAGAFELVSPDIFLIGNGGISGNFEVVGALSGGPGTSTPFNFAIKSLAPATTMTISGADLSSPIIYLTMGSLSANATLTLNTSAAGIWYIMVGFTTFNSHHLYITNSIGGTNITSTPAGTPASTQIITAISMGDGTALWLSTTTIT